MTPGRATAARHRRCERWCSVASAARTAGGFRSGQCRVGRVTAQVPRERQLYVGKRDASPLVARRAQSARRHGISHAIVLPQHRRIPVGRSSPSRRRPRGATRPTAFRRGAPGRPRRSASPIHASRCGLKHQDVTCPSIGLGDARSGSATIFAPRGISRAILRRQADELPAIRRIQRGPRERAACRYTICSR